MLGLNTVLLGGALAVGSNSVAGVREPVPYAWFVAVLYVVVACTPLQPVFPALEGSLVRGPLLRRQRLGVAVLLLAVGLPVLAVPLPPGPLLVGSTVLLAVTLGVTSLAARPAWLVAGVVGLVTVGLQVMTPLAPIDWLATHVGPFGAVALLVAGGVVHLSRTEAFHRD